MKEKISVILVLFVLMLGCVYTPVNAALSCNTELKTSKTEYNKTEKIVVDVNLSNVKTENGIVAFSAILKYDTKSLKLEKMEGQDGWSNPSYNSDNGKFVMDNSKPLTNDANILKLTFEILENSEKNLAVTLENINIANGVDKIVVINSVSKNVVVKDNEEVKVPETNTEDDKKEEEDKKPENNTTTDDKKEEENKKPENNATTDDKKEEENKKPDNNTTTDDKKEEENKKPENNTTTDDKKEEENKKPENNTTTDDKKEEENKKPENNNTNTNDKKEENKKPTTSNTDDKKDNTQATGMLPATGISNIKTILIAGIVIFIIIAIIYCIKIIKINEK